MAAPLTILGEHLAKRGATFTYEGETDAACASCRLRKVCQNLKPHHRYRVTKVRDVTHKGVCSVFEGNVKVVEVEEVPVTVTLPVKRFMGTAYSKRWEECGAACRLKRYCDPAALDEGQMAAIEDVGEDVECLVGRKLKFATVRPK